MSRELKESEWLKPWEAQDLEAGCTGEGAGVQVAVRRSWVRHL